MAGAQFNARPQLTAAVNGLATVTEGSQGRLLRRTLRVRKDDETEEDYIHTNIHIYTHTVCTDMDSPLKYF